MTQRLIVITYTYKYREGGNKFERAAQVMAEEKKTAGEVILEKTESKAEFAALMQRIADTGQKIDELHFIGHSGVYGIMFGTRAWPEQFSPHEWEQLAIPFADDAAAWFHACRTGRWFAPFFSRTFGVTTYGHYWYTTVSRSPDKFLWEGSGNPPLYIISCPGRKSHGLLASAAKYLGLQSAIPMRKFDASRDSIDRTYDAVAEDYDATFADIAVRRDEMRWLDEHAPLSATTKVLDIGCGNGALLAHLRDRIGSGQGVDISAGMIAMAQKRQDDKLSFAQIDGPSLPFPDESFDVVISLLSFRYLDWDPMVREVQRVLKPGGRFIVIDMVTTALRPSEWPWFLRDKVREILNRRSAESFARNLRKMVTSKSWQTMLEHNPIRSEHEMKWYLQSRFPGSRFEIINYGFSARIAAFLSPPINKQELPELTYP